MKKSKAKELTAREKRIARCAYTIGVNRDYQTFAPYTPTNISNVYERCAKAAMGGK